MSGMPEWMSDLIEKGTNVKECLEMWRQEQESKRELERERWAQEREERQAQRESVKLEVERDVKLRELAIREKELEHAKIGGSQPHKIKCPPVKLPKFEEGQDPDVFLRSFEKIAGLQKWHKSQWAIRLVPMLAGKALEAYSRLSDADSDNYEIIKTAILKRYELTSEDYREKFRQGKQSNDESFKDFVVRVERCLNHWCEGEKIDSDFGKLYDMVLREQVVRSCPKDLQLWILEHDPKSIEEVVALSNAFQAAHKSKYLSGNSVQFLSTGNRSTGKPNKFGSTNSQDANCFLKRTQSKGQDSKGQRGTKPEKRSENVGLCLDKSESKVADNIQDTTKGRVILKLSGVDNESPVIETSAALGWDLVKGQVSDQPVAVLRDTGCSTVFVRSKFISDSDKTGRSRVITLADGSQRNCDEAMVDLKTPYVSGKVHALVLDSPFADVIIGNNVSILKPMEDEKEVKRDGDDENTCAAVQTRLQSKLEQGNSNSQRKATEEDSEDESLKQLWCSRDKLVELQESDDSLKSALSMAQDDTQEGKSYFQKQDGLLYRIFQKDSGEKFSQIVIPKTMRSKVMSLAHDTPLAGHLGNKKTRQRIMQHFFWPGMYIDISRFCKSCSICQKGTPKGRTPKAPLIPIPPIEEPFSRIAIDFVGPLPLTEKKNRYILVCMDYSTRYPEAFPLKNQEAETVANTLIELFSRVGVPNEILSDQGTNFMSTLMTELCKLLQAYASSEPHRWDVHLPYVLFAYREVPNETTGYSPFELLYGRHVRGPLAILKEQWEEPTVEQASVLSYILETRERMQNIRDLVKDSERLAKKKQKMYYDKKARTRTFEVGQKVLVLLPTSTSKLMAQWKGPYEVVKKVSPVDYKVRISKNKEPIYHVNMLKEWLSRDSEEKCPKSNEVLACMDAKPNFSDEDDCTNNRAPILQQTESSDNVEISSELSEEQKRQLKRLVEEFENVFTDVPKKTSYIQHTIKTTTEEPIQKKPYSIPYALQEKVKAEIKQMKEMGIIEETESPYSAPIVLIKKNDDTLRFCVDYRDLNKVTVFDPRPMPRMDDILNKISRAKYISKLDLTKGYWQVPLDDEAKQKSAFVTPFGHFSFTVMPFGMVNAPATFVRLVSKVLEGHENYAEAFIDDIGVFSDSWEDHLVHLREIFTALQNANLAARPSKCKLGFGEVQAIQNVPVPNTKKKVRSFLGLIGFYRKFIPNFSSLALPLTDLTKKNSPHKIKWTDNLDTAFKELKGKLACEPILHSPDFSRMFVLRTDASATGAGAVLEQEFDTGKHPIFFLSKKFTAAEKNYAVIEKECYAIIWAVKTLRVYLEGKQFVIETDHAPLTWLQRSKLSNQRLLRWSLLLQEFCFTVRYIPGNQNVIADALSRSSEELE
ncbi:uncharacterized protein LOC134250727 [Saccostrea cucullata]|uniref:uncharacterized protein LOC134250727 n=1 Tax=Saccostrea cuccullata TaxID=36930 RepID=UPI002ED687B6